MALAARGSRTLSLPRVPLLEMSCRAARFVSREDDMRQVGERDGWLRLAARARATEFATKGSVKVVRATSHRAPWRAGGDRGRGRVGQGSRLGTCYTDDYGSVPGYHE